MKLLRFPDVMQPNPYTCGPGALQGMLTYYQGQEPYVDELIREATTNDGGTPPTELARVARQRGLSLTIKENMTIRELEKSIDAGHPVMVVGQAWRGPEELQKPWNQVEEAGHYMVAIGYDDHNLIFEDPASLGFRGSIPKDEWNDRWHDWDRNGKPYNHMGIVAEGTAVPTPPRPFQYIP